MVVDEDSWYPVAQLCVAMAPSSLGEELGLYMITPLERVRSGQMAVRVHTRHEFNNTPPSPVQTGSSPVLHPVAVSTRPHHQSSHLVASGTGVGSRGVHSSGGGGWVVPDHSIGWDAEVWTGGWKTHIGDWYCIASV